MKKNFTFYVFVLMLAMLTLGVLTFLLPDSAFSENENRMLKTKDGISLNVLDGSFQSDLETYLSDQSPLRLFATTLQTRMKLLFGRKDIGGAYIGKHGRLFQKITDSDVDFSAVQTHAARYEHLAEQTGLPLTLLPVPSAGCMMPELLPAYAEMYALHRCFNQISTAAPQATIVDTRNALANWNYYYKTDHHWTTSGAYMAYRAWRFNHGEKVTEYTSFSPKTVTDDFRGTLYSKVLDSRIPGEPMELIAVPELHVTADGKEIAFYDEGALQTKDKYNVFQSGNHGIVTIENPALHNGKTLLLIKDSFANSLVPFLTYDYEKIVMLDERYTTVVLSDFAENVGATEIAVVKEAAFF